MKYLNSAIAALALGLGLPAPAMAQPPTTACNIDVLSTPQGIVLRPIARSRTAVSGTYRLSVETSGPAGRSTVSQGGDFSVRGAREQTLGSVSLGHSSGGLAQARVELFWAGGRTSCARRVRL